MHKTATGLPPIVHRAYWNARKRGAGPFISPQARAFFVDLLRFQNVEEDRESKAEGWAVFNRDGDELRPVIERLDEPEDSSEPAFEDDGQAAGFVVYQAQQGVPHACRALLRIALTGLLRGEE